VPAMLMAAGHVKNDVPSEIHEAKGRHPRLAFSMARPIDIHPALLELCRIRYREALEGRADIDAAQTLLLLVGRGTSDPDANANIARVARFLWEAYGAGWAGIAFSGVTLPSVDEALTVCRRLGYARIVVQPYFLCEGLLLKRVRETVARHAAESNTEIFATSHLGLHPLLLQALEDRAHEAAHGTPNMNCELCRYRVRIAGREADLGQPQFGHHHHVRALEDAAEDHGHPPSRRVVRQNAPAGEVAAGHPWDERLLQRLQLAN
jgi:sirohydrochlorin cobaltochelatase